MSKLLVQIFENQLAEDGIARLRAQYPATLKINMKNDAEFKAARKTRTERNKLVEDINRRRLDVTGEIKTYGDNLINQVNEIYDVVVLPFEEEDQARKIEAAREAKELAEKLEAESKRIKAIYEMYNDCRGKSSDHIQGIIEAVDLIETECFHKDLIHEAIEVKKDTLKDLTQLLSDTISREKFEAQRLEMEQKQAEADEKQRKIEREQQITERINALKMIPSGYFDKTSTEIKNKIKSISVYDVTEQDFGDKVEEVEAARITVIKQLSQMADNQQRIEEIDKAEKERLEEERKAAEIEIFKAQQLEAKIQQEEKIEPEIAEVIEQPEAEEYVEKGEIAQCHSSNEERVTTQPSLRNDLTEWAKRYDLPEIAKQELHEILLQYGFDLFHIS
jgi:hypothetical protein